MHEGAEEFCEGVGVNLRGWEIINGGGGGGGGIVAGEPVAEWGLLRKRTWLVW